MRLLFLLHIKLLSKDVSGQIKDKSLIRGLILVHGGFTLACYEF